MKRLIICACGFCLMTAAPLGAQERLQPLWLVPQESLQEAIRRPLFTPDRKGVPYWSLKGATGPDAEQLFLNDPCGNMVELHQFDKCRCRLKSRVK